MSFTTARKEDGGGQRYLGTRRLSFLFRHACSRARARYSRGGPTIARRYGRPGSPGSSEAGHDRRRGAASVPEKDSKSGLGGEMMWEAGSKSPSHRAALAVPPATHRVATLE